MSGVRQSKITKGLVLTGLGGKGLRKRDGQIGPAVKYKVHGCIVFEPTVRTCIIRYKMDTNISSL